MNIRELRARARAVGLEVDNLTKEEIVRALAADVRLLREALPELRDPVQLRLWNKPLKQLKEMASAHGVRVGENSRSALVWALARNPGVRLAMGGGALGVPPPLIRPQPPAPPTEPAPPEAPAPEAEAEPIEPEGEPTPPPAPLPPELPGADTTTLLLPPGDTPPSPSGEPGEIFIEPEPPEATLAETPQPPEDAELARALEPPREFARLQETLLEIQGLDRGGDHGGAARVAAEAVTSLSPATEAFGRWAWAQFLLSLEALTKEATGPAEALARVQDLLVHVRDALTSERWGGRGDLLQEVLRAAEGLDASAHLNLEAHLQDLKGELDQVVALGVPASSVKTALERAANALATGDRPGAQRILTTAAGHLAELRQRGLQEAGAYVESLGAGASEARTLGADVTEASAALEEARAALGREEVPRLREALGRAERLVIQAQRAQVDLALDAHRRQVERVVGMARRMKPILAEAQMYSLEVGPLRSITVEALRSMKRGDYVDALLAVRRAEDEARALVPGLLRERTRRGISKPPAGLCGRCASRDLEFHDDGWGLCRSCGMEFRWRKVGPQAFLKRLGEGLRRPR